MIDPSHRLMLIEELGRHLAVFETSGREYKLTSLEVVARGKEGRKKIELRMSVAHACDAFASLDRVIKNDGSMIEIGDLQTLTVEVM